LPDFTINPSSSSSTWLSLHSWSKCWFISIISSSIAKSIYSAWCSTHLRFSLSLYSIFICFFTMVYLWRPTD
jgi:hypothetical protein